METALGANGGERRLHHAYAKLLIASNLGNEQILYHLQRSFSAGDSNYDARLLYGRQLYLSGDRDGAFLIFKELKAAPVSPETKFEVLYPVVGAFTGEITRMEATYCFISRDGVGDTIYAHRGDVGDAWPTLEYRKRVRFRIGFAFGGARAFDVQSDSTS